MLPEGPGIGAALQPEVPQSAQEGPQGDKAARHGEDPARPVEGLPTASERLQAHLVGCLRDLVLEHGHSLGGPVPRRLEVGLVAPVDDALGRIEDFRAPVLGLLHRRLDRGAQSGGVFLGGGGGGQVDHVLAQEPHLVA